MERNALLRSFGIALMNQVRDPAIVGSRMILDGSSQACEDQAFLPLIQSLSEESKLLLEQLIIKTIDLTIFNSLSLFEQQEEFVLAARTEEGLVDLNESSDGLGGELWGDDGWIAQFSAPNRYLDDDA